MPDIIRLLPDSLANQIAAGEVVQRPASVVKELLENALDAGADRIDVVIREAGKTLVQVVDNGSGMSETDARMALERHATSKIRTSEDLFAIHTMGFRGEAMASIAAVAQMEIRTRQPGEELGTLICVEGSTLKKQEPVAHQPGTSILVKNLFYNVPARRNFLKSNSVEMKHIVEEFQRVALARPDVAMSLYQNDLETYNLSAGKLSHRIVGLFGNSYREQLASCQEEVSDFTVHGYVGKPEASRKTRGEQFLFVNGRYIKSNYLNHAVTQAYEGLIPEGNFPFYVLFIDLPPSRVDVNVHPTKTEVKFDDERTLYALVHSAVKQALARHNLTPALDFSHDVNTGQKLSSERQFVQDMHYSQFKTAGRESGNLENWKKLYEENPGKPLVPESWAPQDEIEDRRGTTLRFESRMNDDEEKEKPAHLFQLHRKYIVAQVKSGMMLINQQSAHERICYEKFLKNMQAGNAASQQSLFPQTISLNPGDVSLVKEMQNEIAALGFDIEEFGQHDFLIKGIPADIQIGNEKTIFEGLIEQFKHNASVRSLPVRENLAQSLARRTAIRPGAELQPEEMRDLVDQLFACSNPNYAPDGRATFILMSMESIANQFNT
ncbi:MAG: DNA mismatch repair endonuclease MutL [Cyclobacteriaceae bacterium]